MKVVIVHGSYGSPEGNWFPWLKGLIEQLGHEAIVPRFPTPVNQNLASWTSVFASDVGSLDSRTILIGHSLGAGFILNLLEDDLSEAAKATFLVAGFTGKLGLPDYDQVNETFVCKEFEWNRIKANAGQLYVVNGDNDPYVPIEKGKQIAEALSVPHLVIPGGGHLNAEFGYDTFPVLADRLRSLLEPNSDANKTNSV